MGSLIMNGVVVPGIGQATRCLGMQMPHFLKFMPDLARFVPSTINIQLDNNLIISEPDYETSPIKWCSDPPEIFAFLWLKIIVPTPYQEADAVLYLPYDSPHRKDFRYHEIITEKLKLTTNN